MGSVDKKLGTGKSALRKIRRYLSYCRFPTIFDQIKLRPFHILVCLGRPAVIVATNGFTLRIDPFLLNPRPGLEIERTKLDYTQYAFNRYQRQKRPKVSTLAYKGDQCH